MKRVLILAGCTLLTLGLFAKVTPPVETISEVKGMYPTLVNFSADNAPAFVNGKITFEADNTSKSQNIRWSAHLVNTEKDADGTEHIRYQQTIKGVPVENAYYILHIQNGKVFMQNGKFVQDVSTALKSTVSVIKEEQALQSALNVIGAKTYKWQLPEEEAFLKKEKGTISATYYPKGELVYYSGEEDVVPADLHLAYKFNIYAAEPLSRQLIFVDAQTGKILGSRSLIEESDVSATAITVYSGTRTITADSYNGSYRLRETGRGNGIQTYNLKKTTNYNTATDFTDDDNYWDNVNTAKDQYATDAHFGAESTYDFYKNVFDRNSIDNAGFLIKSYVHYSTKYFNAFWDGERMTYGDGDGAHGNKPLTGLDVCGHEITHGLTSYTANLNYSGESGALNEGFSDILGTCIEWYTRPEKADWFIGKDFFTIRSMSNPNGYGQPDTYKGFRWMSTSHPSALNDYGGVHINSGVLNYWFYLLTNGGKGTNDKRYKFNVTGIGIEKARQIVYRTLTVYLISTSKYHDARTYSIQAAQDLFGMGSNEVAQVVHAWDAVGVATGSTTTFRLSNTEETADEQEKIIEKEIRIYPNPASSVLNIDFYTEKEGTVVIQLIDLSGKMALEQISTTQEGINSIQLNLPALSKGTYIVQINGKTESKVMIAE